ncbi:uncharacterized protein V1516DRAFT_637816 [Lipomyces oligophaga]|uniref:uncharacterized protein n=1 Tax=Lipomyces oligophaga TaxID=45792 RepID=UPI0034CDDA5B
MSIVGSLIFCTDCGNLLDSKPSAMKRFICGQCGAQYPANEFENLTVITKSSETAFPSSLRLKKSVVKTSLEREEQQEGATINEKCPQCGKNEMQYYSLQLRSADEGATIFYTCTDCGYKFSTNN